MVFSFQAENNVRKTLSGNDLTLADYRREYRDILQGRYGRNLGIEKGIADIGLAQCFHMYDTLEIIGKNLSKIEPDKIDSFLEKAGLSNIVTSTDKQANDGRISIRKIKQDSGLEGKLRKVDFKEFKSALQNTDFGVELNQQLEFAVSNQLLPKTTEGLEKGRQIVSELEKEGLRFSKLASNGRLSEFDRAAMSIILYKVNESEPYKIGKNLYKYLQDPYKTLYGDIEADTKPFDVLLKDEIKLMADTLAKKQILTNITGTEIYKSDKNEEISLVKRNRNNDGISLLSIKEEEIKQKILDKLQNNGYSNDNALTTFSLDRAVKIFEDLSKKGAEKLIPALRRIPPLLWKKGISIEEGVLKCRE